MEVVLGQHIAVCGPKGSGKTSLARHMVMGLEASRKFIFYCKPEDKFTWLSPKGRPLPNSTYYMSGEDLAMKLAMLRASGKYEDSIIFIDDQQAVTDWGTQGDYPKDLGYFILAGRSKRCTVMLNLHWLRRFPVTLRDEMDWWFVGRPGMMADDMYEDMFGKTIAGAAIGLGQFQFLKLNIYERNPSVIGPVKSFTKPTGAERQNLKFD